MSDVPALLINHCTLLAASIAYFASCMRADMPGKSASAFRQHADCGRAERRYDAGKYSYFAPASSLFMVQMVLFAWVEFRRWQDMIKPGRCGLTLHVTPACHGMCTRGM